MPQTQKENGQKLPKNSRSAVQSAVGRIPLIARHLVSERAVKTLNLVRP